jgi:hypothetical protein
MFATIKMIGLTAALSAGVVTAYDLPQTHETAPVSSKIYQDRILPTDEAAPAAARVVLASAEAVTEGKGDRAGLPCAAQAWPNIAPECVANGQNRKPVRTITIERREAGNVSTLVRVPAAAELARR